LWAVGGRGGGHLHGNMLATKKSKKSNTSQRSLKEKTKTDVMKNHG